MNLKTLRARLPSEPGRCSCQDLPLLAQPAYLPAQTATPGAPASPCRPDAGLHLLEGLRRAVVGEAAEHVLGPDFGEHGFWLEQAASRFGLEV